MVQRVKIEGVAELKASLEALGTEVATKVGVSANRKAAQAFRKIIKDAAPYDPTPRVRPYGHLRDNIRIKRVKARKQGNIIYQVTTGRAFWAAFQEFGTATQAARPFMRPAFETNKEKLVDVQIGELRTGIEKAAKRLARGRR